MKRRPGDVHRANAYFWRGLTGGKRRSKFSSIASSCHSDGGLTSREVLGVQRDQGGASLLIYTIRALTKSIRANIPRETEQDAEHKNAANTPRQLRNILQLGW